MRLEDFQLELTQVPGAMPVWRGRVDAGQYREACQQVRDKGGRLVALWATDGSDRGEGFSVHAALTVRSGLLVITLPLAGTSFPDVSHIFPAANRMQRVARDLFGVSAENAADQRQWLRHAAWPANVFPLRKEFLSAHHSPLPAYESCAADDYPFVRVEGEGVHEIPVGPVHAGTIEPGHFRFSVVGEGVLRLEARLGYKHKGIEKRSE
jgi:Ni,Fe-hydrogenase III component G